MSGMPTPALYWSMLRHWTKMAAGRSYWHISQGLGKQFAPGMLAGYFNDLTGKAAWRGQVDRRGLPLVRINGALRYSPVTIFQKGLGHWDLWLESERRDASHFAEFERIAEWALATQDQTGGWSLPALDADAISPYSAMSQGQAVSLLCRAHLATGRPDYLSSALHAAQLMITPASSGGTARPSPQGLVLDEVPLLRPRIVWNGWVFAIYGLYDLTLLRYDANFRDALSSTLLAFAACLPSLDAGFWSYYDSGGALASTFYHRLHIVQLRAMEKTFPQCKRDFCEMATHFEDCLGSRVKRVRATVLKGCQKLLHPPSGIVE